MMLCSLIHAESPQATHISVSHSLILIVVILILILIDIIFLLILKYKYTIDFKNKKLAEYIDKALKKEDTNPTLYK
ncbi:hypothetical protein DW103_11565 [Parabacteroides sp. AM08-6]|nr:hypothetical protein DW103_11565 [Parabacteroides sp. AM08-6]